MSAHCQPQLPGRVGPPTPLPQVPINFLSGGLLGKQILAVQTSHLWFGPKSSVTQQNQSSSAHGSFRHIQACICSLSSLLVFHQDLAIPVLPTTPHDPAVRPWLQAATSSTCNTEATPQCRP